MRVSMRSLRKMKTIESSDLFSLLTLRRHLPIVCLGYAVSRKTTQVVKYSCVNESFVFFKTSMVIRPSSPIPLWPNVGISSALWSRSHLNDRSRFLSRPNVGICTRIRITPRNRYLSWAVVFLILEPAPSLWAWHASSEARTGMFGKYSSSLILRMIGGKIPGGFNSSLIKSYLSKTWGPGPSLLLGTTLEPAMRFRSEAEAKAWLDGVAASYLFPSLIFYIGSRPSALLVTPRSG
jgi:hypothetical protein